MHTSEQRPVFNDTYHIIKSLGEGNTSKVYLGRQIAAPHAWVAIKVMKEEFLTRDKDSILAVQNEITILKHMQHFNIVQMYDYGNTGSVLKPSGRVIPNLVFIVMEYVAGGLLFDLCQLMQNMGEDVGRFFAIQMLDSIDYMHQRRVVHRDLKLENILVDDHLNLKVADFGFASYKSIDALKSYRGTMTYMAPEIKEGKKYNGQKVDLFSFGVILFIIVHGIFPFKEARMEEYFYNLLQTGQADLYFQKVNGQSLSPEFKDLIQALFSYHPENRPSVDQIRAHPWLTKAGFNPEKTRQRLLFDIEKSQAKIRADKTEQVARSQRGVRQ